MWLERASLCIAKAVTLSRRRFYHGTSTRFGSFDLDKAGARDFGDFGLGVYLTPSSQLAAQYAYASAKRTKGEPVVAVVEVHVHKTADFDDKAFEQQVAEATRVPFPKVLSGPGPQTRPRADAVAITKYLQSEGYDSALARNGKELIVYDVSALRIESVRDAADASFLP